jgi:hypothetical protein
MMTEWLWDKERVLRFSALRGVYWGTFALFFLFTEWGRKVYRPYVYGGGLTDRGLADVVGNLTGSLAVFFFNLTFLHATRAQGLRAIGLVTAGLVAYELVQGILPRSVFDWADVAATLAAGGIAVGLLLAIHALFPERPDAEETLPRGA